MLIPSITFCATDEYQFKVMIYFLSEYNLIQGKNTTVFTYTGNSCILTVSISSAWSTYTLYCHCAYRLLKLERKKKATHRNCNNYIPYPIQFPHRNTENDVPFSRPLIWFLPFFDFQCHQVRYQCLHFDRIRRNSAKIIKQQRYIH